MKLYHFYFDQGGLGFLGDAWIIISPITRRSHKNLKNKHILDYYCGHMTKWAIESMIVSFKKEFPKCPIHYDLGSIKLDSVNFV